MRRVFRLPDTRARLARDVDEELAFHLETRVATARRARIVAGRRAPRSGAPVRRRRVGSAVVRHDGRTTGAIDAARELRERRNPGSGVHSADAPPKRRIHVPRRRRAGDRHRRQHGDLRNDRRGVRAWLAGAASGGVGRRGRPDACQLSFVRIAAHGYAVRAGVPGGARQQHRLHRRSGIGQDGSPRRPSRRRRARASAGTVRLRELLLRARHLGLDRKSVRRQPRIRSPAAPRRSRSATDTGSGVFTAIAASSARTSRSTARASPSSASRPSRSPATSSSNGPISGFRWGCTT